MRVVAAALLVLALAVLPAAGAAGGEAEADPPPGLFGSLEFRTGNLAAIRQWASVLDRIAAEQEIVAACDDDIRDCPSPQAIAWRAMVHAQRGRHPLRQLRDVNAFVNDIVPYRIDRDVFGVSDYWASPLEFLERSGDCEDFAIMKYETLLALGFSNDQMRIAVVNDTIRNLPHAVLIVEYDGRVFVLDSLIDVVVGHEALRQYVPQYSVNRTHRWAHIATPELAARFYDNLSQ
jgi:predicted transglutaminase-like cysteine proteinase